MAFEGSTLGLEGWRKPLEAESPKRFRGGRGQAPALGWWTRNWLQGEASDTGPRMGYCRPCGCAEAGPRQRPLAIEGEGLRRCPPS